MLCTYNVTGYISLRPGLLCGKRRRTARGMLRTLTLVCGSARDWVGLVSWVAGGWAGGEVRVGGGLVLVCWWDGKLTVGCWGGAEGEIGGEVVEVSGRGGAGRRNLRFLITVLPEPCIRRRYLRYGSTFVTVADLSHRLKLRLVRFCIRTCAPVCKGCRGCAWEL